MARLAKAFGMVVHYYDIKRLKEEEEDALGVRFRLLLPEILRHSDIVSLRAAQRLDPGHARRPGARRDEAVGHHRQHLARLR